jgi:hypothetical protein
MNLKQMETDLRKLKRQMASMANTTVEGYTRTESGGGVAFGEGAKRILPAYIAPKTVVIIQEPVANDSTLLVREAKYTSIPPKKCTGVDPNVTCFYDWAYPDFEVYPPLGKEAIDYAGDEKTSRLVNDVPTDVLNSALEAPELGTVFHRCHREHEVWVLDLQADGGASIVFVRIIDKVGSSDSGQFLIVQKMKKVEPVAPETIVTWVPDGEPEPAECWPNYTVAHYMPMRFQNPEVIVPMTKVGGTQYVWQKNRMFLAKPVSSLPHSDCVVPIGS